jgi:hypothetical protein
MKYDILVTGLANWRQISRVVRWRKGKGFVMYKNHLHEIIRLTDDPYYLFSIVPEKGKRQCT